jgi:hypothetical protein
MATKKVIQDFGRQYTLAAVQAFDYTDSLDGTLEALSIQLPVNAIITGGYINVTTAFDTGTTHVLDLDDDGTGTTAILNAVNLKSAAITEISGLGEYVDGTAVTGNLQVTDTPAGTDPTAGQGYIVVEYVVVGRANENQD